MLLLVNIQFQGGKSNVTSCRPTLHHPIVDYFPTTPLPVFFYSSKVRTYTCLLQTLNVK